MRTGWIAVLLIVLVSAVLFKRLPARAREQVFADSITVPARQAQTTPLRPVLPELPSSAENITPLTLTVTTRWEEPGKSPRRLRQTVLRTRDRVLVSVEGAASDWLFVRNPIDHRRLSASLSDHRTRRVLVHDESDLRNTQGVRGWLDVLTLRIDPSALKALRDTGRRETVAGIEFVEYARDAASGADIDGIVGVWWSESHLLPLRFIVREGRVLATSDVQIGAGPLDDRALAPASVRFPHYTVMDIADARESGSP